MNRPAQFAFDRTIGIVNRLAEHVQHTPQRLGAHGHRDGTTLVGRRHAALQTVGRLHRDRAHAVLTEVLLDFDDDVDFDIAGFAGDAERVVDRRQMSVRELDVHHGADDLNDLANLHCFCDCHLVSSTAGLKPRPTFDLLCLGARHDFDNFAGNCRLPHLVHGERQAFDHFSRVARRSIHCRHSRRVFRR